MGLLVLLMRTDRAEVPIGSTAIEVLSHLGITSVSLAADDETTAIILEGWAFDPTHPGPAIHALTGGAEATRALQPIAQMAVSAASRQGGTS